MPAELIIHPDDTILRVGDTTRFKIDVLDQHGVPFAGVPAWATQKWKTPDPAAVYLWDDGRVEAGTHVDTEVRATFAGLTARTRLRVNPERLLLSVPAVTVTQAVQNIDGDVPLIAGRTALMRIFATGDLPSFYRPPRHRLLLPGRRAGALGRRRAPVGVLSDRGRRGSARHVLQRPDTGRGPASRGGAPSSRLTAKEPCHTLPAVS